MAAVGVRAQAPVMYGCKRSDRSFHLSSLYYCHNCQDLRNPLQVCEEIDSFFCPGCLENMASVEASRYKHRCKKCFVCPQCFVMLNYSRRGTGPDAVYFLNCGNCKWSSFDVGVIAASPNELVVDNLSREKENVLQTSFMDLLQTLQKKEQQREKEKRTANRFRRYYRGLSFLPHAASSPGGQSSSSLHSPSRSSPSGAVSVASLPPQSLSQLDKQQEEKYRVLHFSHQAPAVSPQPATLTHITTLESGGSLLQSFNQMDIRPSGGSNGGSGGGGTHAVQLCERSLLRPSRMPLMTRRSKRCSECDKLLIKPDLSPAKAGFKRQHVAMSYVPALRLLSKDYVLVKGRQTKLVLKVDNPLHHVVHFQITNNTPKEVAEIMIHELPTFLSPCEYDDESRAQSATVAEDAPEVKSALEEMPDDVEAMERRGSRLYLRFFVLPLQMVQATDDQCCEGDGLKVCFSVSMRYKGTSGEQSATFPITIMLGSVDETGEKADEETF
eukprot:TRINITY_DN15459_c0_g1_i1.p1 TRINITY_DN15459_c0_g1~~TRINITY_DN15459_c0_g1_i1.p1  ORF type:complete len:498 (-),score=109.43 TRINITY_DN15459_c0_g1_i1:41-1534(-)